MRSLYTTLALTATFIVLVIATIVFDGKIEYVTWTPASVAVFLGLARRRINRYKPANVDDY